MKKIFIAFLSLFVYLTTFAQNNAMPTEAATGLRANDKIWVVMTICLTILAGLFIYLINLDKKISTLENK